MTIKQKICVKLYPLALKIIKEVKSTYPKRDTSDLERLTYHSGNEVYLNYGKDATWQNMPGYELIKQAIEKLAEYEDSETDNNQNNVWHVIADNDYPKTFADEVLVTLKNGVVREANWFGMSREFKFVSENKVTSVYKENPVIAWMEKPEAYEYDIEEAENTVSERKR